MANGRGGKRPGAGRPARGICSKTVLRKDVASKMLAKSERLPLEVMLTAMNRAVDVDDWDKAAGFAKEAAPYLHAKLSAIQHSGDQDKPLQTILQIVTGVVRDAESVARQNEELRKDH